MQKSAHHSLAEGYAKRAESALTAREAEMLRGFARFYRALADQEEGKKQEGLTIDQAAAGRTSSSRMDPAGKGRSSSRSGRLR